MASATQSRPSVLMTLLLLVGVVVFMAPLLALFAAAHVDQTIFGYLFLLYWAAILKQDPKAYLETIVGGIAGILLAVLLYSGPRFGAVGMAVGYVVLAAVLFCFMRQQFKLVINNALMLYLAVATIPALNCVANFPVMIAALVIAALYMGAWSLAIRRFGPARSAKVQTPSDLSPIPAAI